MAKHRSRVQYDGKLQGCIGVHVEGKSECWATSPINTIRSNIVDIIEELRRDGDRNGFKEMNKPVKTYLNDIISFSEPDAAITYLT